MLETSAEGKPRDTGTLCPAFPQVQPPVSIRASSATIVTFRRHSGPLPMMFVSLIGAVILPFSISQPFLM